MRETGDSSPRRKRAMEWRRAFGRRFEQARAAADITFESIAEHLDCSKALPHHWASGYAECPSPDIEPLTQLLRVRVEWMLTGKGRMLRFGIPRKPLYRTMSRPPRFGTRK